MGGIVKSILDVSPDELGQWLAAEGEAEYRADQIMEWVYGRRAESFAAMSNLPVELRGRLEASFGSVIGLREAEHIVSEDGGTGKLLFELDDGKLIESVWMNGGGFREADGVASLCSESAAEPSGGGSGTFCISSQAGCALGCRFCATGAAGFGRDLTVGEILGQVTALARGTGGVHNVVFMGMGEPLLNLGAVVPALESLGDPRRFGLGARHITVSTSGVTPGIAVLAGSAVRPNLALSLNSPFDGQRSELMPVNRRYPLAGVLDACEEYAGVTGRRMTLEYVLLGGVNTSKAAARAVAAIAERLGALVNVIVFNAVAGCDFKAPTKDEVRLFKAVVRAERVTVTERFRRGRDIGAACGQLRGKHRGGD